VTFFQPDDEVVGKLILFALSTNPISNLFIMNDWGYNRC